MTAPTARFRFDFDPLYRILAAPFGVTPQTTMVEVTTSRLVARFGPWVIDTPLANIAGVETSGPYSIWKTVGPAHLSIADWGLTMATNRRRGMCVRFVSPVRGIDPFGWIRHPALTVTVDEIDKLRSVLTRSVDERTLTDITVGVPGESPWALLARLGRWPLGVIVAARRYLKLRTSAAVVRTYETSVGTHPSTLSRRNDDGDVQPLDAGDGAVYERWYRVTVRDCQLTPAQLLDRIASDLNRVSPPEVAEFVSQSSDTSEAQPEQEFMVRMPGPWKAPVRCVERTQTSFCLATLPGHMEAGQIEFRTRWADGPDDDAESRAVQFEVHSVARSRGTVYRMIYDRLRLASEMQWYMWVRLCQRVAELAGGRPDGPVEVRTVRHEG